MAERNKLSQIPSQRMPERPTNFLSRMADEAIGAFERYGRRSGAQRDASLAMLNQAVDPNTDPLTGAGMKALGLAGLVTHPLAFFPTREEWDQRLEAAGNTGRMSRSIGGFLSDLPSLIDPQMAAGGAALAAAPLAARMMNKADDAGIIAYHGSPHSFDKFDMSKIGTGEGNQAYMRGLYFAENEGTAQSYRDVLSGNRAPSADDLAKLSIDDQMKISDAIQAAGEKAGFNTASPDAFWLVMNRLAGKQSKTMHPVHDRAMLALDEVEKYVPEDIKSLISQNVTPAKGSMYQVKINVKPDELLDWDKPLSEQPKNVQKAVGGYVKSPDEPIGVQLNIEGRQRDGSDQWVIDDLKKQGVKGVRYKDAGSRDKLGGTYNYVVFDDSLITILKKYGIPMTIGAGGAMMVAGQDMPPEFAAQMGGT